MDCKMMTVRSFLKAIAGAVALVGLVTFAQAEDKSLDPSGTWTWTTPGRNGGPDRTSTLTLKSSGGTVTGSLSTPGRGGNPNKTDIANVKVEGKTISFEVTRERNGTSTTTVYKGTLEGDTITGTTKIKDGDRPERKWSAKRSTGATTGS